MASALPTAPTAVVPAWPGFVCKRRWVYYSVIVRVKMLIVRVKKVKTGENTSQKLAWAAANLVSLIH